MIKGKKNTLDSGRVRWIVFEEEGTWFGVALEFNLAVEADDPQLALSDLHTAIRGYVVAARKSKMRTSVLNQEPAAEYAILWKFLEQREKSKSSKLTVDPKKVFSFGTVPQFA